MPPFQPLKPWSAPPAHHPDPDDEDIPPRVSPGPPHRPEYRRFPGILTLRLRPDPPLHDGASGIELQRGRMAQYGQRHRLSGGAAGTGRVIARFPVRLLISRRTRPDFDLGPSVGTRPVISASLSVAPRGRDLRSPVVHREKRMETDGFKKGDPLDPCRSVHVPKNVPDSPFAGSRPDPR